MNNTTAVCNAPTRKVFAPYFRARWQNWQNVVNDSAYINLIPAGYKTYYQAYIQQWGEWARGFVPMLHRQDFFSTGMGYTVCDIMTRQLMSGGYRLHSNNPETKAFIEEWNKEEMPNVFNRMFFFTNSVGNAILILTPVNGELYLSVLPSNRVVFQVGRKNNVTQALILNRFIAGEDVYYTKELRVMFKGKAYYKVTLAKGTLVTTPTWYGNGLTKVPDCILTQWEEAYGNINPDTWYRMPERMNGIGCYNVKNKSVAVAIADMPGYSDSTLHTALDILYSIDYNYSMAQMDMYIGKSTVLIPKQMSSGKMVQGIPGTATEGMTFKQVLDVQQPELDKNFYTEVRDGNLDGKPIQPTFIQPDLRAEPHKYIRDSDLELLASKVGLNASTIASHLASGTGTKTDDEINSENSTDEKTIGNKRALASTAINQMLSDVAYFYGFENDVEIHWGRASANSFKENDQLMQEYQSNTLSLRDYLRKRWSDLSEEDIEKKAQELEALEEKRRKQEQEAAQFNSNDIFGEINAEDNEYIE
jgi:hypothetical protein